MKEVYIFETRYECPKCFSFNTERKGQRKSTQYRLCKDCKKKFSVKGKVDIETASKKTEVEFFKKDTKCFYF